MRGVVLGLGIALAAMGSPQGLKKKPEISVRNDSLRAVEVAVNVRVGKREVPIGRPIPLPAKSKMRTLPGFFGPPRENAHYTVVIADAKHRRLGLFRLDSRLVRTAERHGMRFTINNQAVNVSVGSRRQRFLLLP
jgi:hypothetical protein